MNKCDKCGGMHWRTAPCIERKKSTNGLALRSPGLASPANAEDARTANTKDAEITTGFDKKAWMRNYMRDYMRAKRAKK